jgi:hypothetical protein
MQRIASLALEYQCRVSALKLGVGIERNGTTDTYSLLSGRWRIYLFDQLPLVLAPWLAQGEEQQQNK